jgi:glycosyltransferase involved in cell wall biosynthesis
VLISFETNQGIGTVDNQPWSHPFLTGTNISRFRSYSERVWQEANSHRVSFPRMLDCAFSVNMAQNMYKWAKLAQRYGAQTTLYLNPQDRTAISRPEWEEFDGEYTSVHDGDEFLEANPGIPIGVSFLEPPNEGSELWAAYHLHPPVELSLEQQGWKEVAERISPELALKLYAAPGAAALRQRCPTLLHAPLLDIQGAYPNFRWAELLAQHDVSYIASTPFPAYVSGKPYCVFSVGGDMQFDCGRPDDLGRAMRAAFAGARFILASNPHTLAHCRRFGFTNAVYLPYPMDSELYCPGQGNARKAWIQSHGGQVFVLTTARIDRGVKGHSDAFFEALATVARERPEVRFVFLGWGEHADAFRARISASGLTGSMFMLPPVGKKRLIDYYRSCDIVLDQFVYGYFGATALEAASIGKPVIMKLRKEQYAPLYRGDVAPMLNADSPEEVRRHLLDLVASPQLRHEVGDRLRQWLVRNHGEQVTVPLMLALLQMAADGVGLPSGVDNPLKDSLSEEEIAYHAQCQQAGPAA